MVNLVPRDTRFFDCFERQSGYIAEAAALLRDLVHGFAEPEAKVRAMKDIEHRGDHVTHEMFRCRIEWTAEQRLPAVERRARESAAFGALRFTTHREREAVLRELDDLEERLAAWLDRFDVIEGQPDRTVAAFLDSLVRIDGWLALQRLVLGRQRPHHHRVTQALALLGASARRRHLSSQ